MANLQENYQWENNIHEWGEDEFIMGGPDGPDNVPPRQLANRTQDLAIKDLLIADMAALGAKESLKTIRQRMQEGAVSVYNRGIIKGCAASKAAVNRKIVLSAGGAFAGGREIPCEGDQVGLTIPANAGATTLTYYAYLSVAASGTLTFSLTAAGAAVPPDGISICRVTVPSGNSAGDLQGVTVTDTRRVESGYPILVNSLPYASIALQYGMIDTAYAVYLDVASFSGQRQAIYPAEKATNGFKIYIDGTMDAVTVRWTAVKLVL
jgi:hypothetical protein